MDPLIGKIARGIAWCGPFDLNRAPCEFEPFETIGYGQAIGGRAPQGQRGPIPDAAESCYRPKAMAPEGATGKMRIAMGPRDGSAPSIGPIPSHPMIPEPLIADAAEAAEVYTTLPRLGLTGLTVGSTDIGMRSPKGWGTWDAGDGRILQCITVEATL